MSGQKGFQTTDPVPPFNGPTFDAEDIAELGLALCMTVWERIKDRPLAPSAGEPA